MGQGDAVGGSIAVGPKRVGYKHPSGLGGGFKYLPDGPATCASQNGWANMFMFIPLVGEMIQFDQYFSGGMKPPTTSSEYFG